MSVYAELNKLIKETVGKLDNYTDGDIDKAINGYLSDKGKPDEEGWVLTQMTVESLKEIAEKNVGNEEFDEEYLNYLNALQPDDTLTVKRRIQAVPTGEPFQYNVVIEVIPIKETVTITETQ